MVLRLSLLLLAACASKEAFRPTSTLSVPFEGEALHVDDGVSIDTECTSSDDSWFGPCDAREFPVYETRVRLGTRPLHLGISGRHRREEPMAKVTGIRARRLSSTVISVQLQTPEAHDRWWICVATSDAHVCGTSIDVEPQSLDHAFATAIASGTHYSHIRRSFGDTPATYALTIERHDFYAVSGDWPHLSTALRVRAIEEAIRALETARHEADVHTTNFLRDHWDQLDERQLERLADALFRLRAYHRIGIDTKLPMRVRERLLQKVLELEPGYERDGFLGTHLGREANRSGIELAVVGERVTIRWVKDDSAGAAAGLRYPDELVRFDGRAVTRSSLAELWKMLRAPAGTRYVVRVRRNGALVDTTLVLTEP